MFRHVNPDMRRWWVSRFLEGLTETAHAAGATEVCVFDAEENLVAQGIVPEPGEEW